MKSRGYGLPGRTAFSIFRFDKRDRAALVFLLLCGGCIFAGSALGGLKFTWFPSIGGVMTPYSAGLFAVYAALCVMPLAVDIYADAKWRSPAVTAGS
jgi:energy-coupling factor transport system permease protein